MKILFLSCEYCDQNFNEIVCHLFSSLCLCCCALTCDIYRLTYVSYQDLRSIPEFVNQTMLVVKAPRDTMMECDRDTTEEVRERVCVCMWDKVKECVDTDFEKFTTLSSTIQIIIHSLSAMYHCDHVYLILLTAWCLVHCYNSWKAGSILSGLRCCHDTLRIEKYAI